MIKQQPHVGHSDQGPSSKDWQPTPEPDRRDKPVRGTSAQAADRVGVGMKKPKRGAQGPDPDDPDQKLDEALEETFPASDAPAPTHPDITGFDVDAEARDRGAKR
jgi:hypothetical protein